MVAADRIEPVARRWILVLILLALLAAGCVGSGSDLDPTSADGDSTDPGDENGSEADNGSQTDEGENESGEEPNESDNETREGNQSGGSQDSGEAGDEEGTGEDEHPPWPDPEDASIRPGVVVRAGGQCTSNFLFATPHNATLMLGVAAHCVADAPDTSTDGCSEEVEPMEPGTQVEVEGASQPGVLVYSSWWTMQTMEDPGEDACRYNDFALVALDPDDREKISPAVKEFGGPTGLASADAVGVGDEVKWYGSTSLTPDGRQTSRHEGNIVSSQSWSFQAYSVIPGVPGDSGSGFMLEDGSAAGVLVTVQTVYPGANGATKLDPALAFAAEQGTPVELVTWPTLS